MNQLERLVSKHAKYSDLKKDLKRRIGVELSNHSVKGMGFDEVFTGDDKLDEIVRAKG